MYTGDDFNYPELIAGDEEGHSDALLGIFDAIAPAAAAALSALARGSLNAFHDILAPTVPLSRHIFKAPTPVLQDGRRVPGLSQRTSAAFHECWAVRRARARSCISRRSSALRTRPASSSIRMRRRRACAGGARGPRPRRLIGLGRAVREPLSRGATGEGPRPTSSRMERRQPAMRDAERTRLRILAAAEAEFADKGLAGGRIDRIARQSGANKRMIYYYFRNKDDVYLAVLERAYAAMRTSEEELDLDRVAPLAAVRRLVEFKFDYFVAHPATISLLNGENLAGAAHLKRSTRLREMHVSLVRRLGTILDRGASDGTLRDGIDPLQLYISISGLSYFFFSNSPTLSTVFECDLASPASRAERRAHVAGVILAYVAAAR